MKKQTNPISTSLIFSVISLLVVLISNFIPLMYFSVTGLPSEYDDVSSHPVFSIAGITGTIALVMLIGGLIATISFYLKSKKSKS